MDDGNMNGHRDNEDLRKLTTTHNVATLAHNKTQSIQDTATSNISMRIRS